MFDSLSEKFSEALKHVQGKGKISENNIEETLKEVRKALLEADVNFKVVKGFISNVKDKALGEKVLKGVNPGEQFVKILDEELTALMGGQTSEIDWSDSSTKIVMVVGLNGAGKTTFSGKLSLYLRKHKKKDVFLVPCDTFRPAAKKQLITLAKNIGVDYFDSDLSLKPAQVALAGIEEGKRLKKEVIIIDTAGRLHIDDELMGELVDVKKALENENPEVLLVADAMTGQEAVNVAKTFHEAVGLTGAVLSKMDSDARGGAALSIKYITGVPLRFVSSGEKMKDLDLFHPDRMSQRILDMGDVLTLVEKAQEAIDEKEAQRVMNNLEKDNFTIEDFLSQMESMKKLGPLSSVLKMIPGMGGALRQVGDLSPAEDEMKRMKVIISSMTHKERKDHKIINDSRRKRIALGSGQPVTAVNDFIKKFEQMRGMMSQMMKMMKGGGLGNMFGGGNMPLGGGFPGGMGGMPQLGQKGKKGKGKGKRKGPWGKGFF